MFVVRNELAITEETTITKVIRIVANEKLARAQRSQCEIRHMRSRIL